MADDAAARARTGPTTSDAQAYLQEVKETFEELDQGDKYEAFLSILEDLKTGRLDPNTVIARMQDLLMEYPNLSSGFKTFLPKRPKINYIVLDDDEEPPRPKKVVDMEKACKFADKLKARLQAGDGAHVFEAFCRILKKYHTENKPVTEIYQEVAPLLKDHPDLLREFGDDYMT
ncbi:Paired amphipathic helix protein Sin3-like 2 [Linum grandiflorum]